MSDEPKQEGEQGAEPRREPPVTVASLSQEAAEPIDATLIALVDDLLGGFSSPSYRARGLIAALNRRLGESPQHYTEDTAE